ncbi:MULTISPECIES: DUF2244 domain-containing protein [Hyphomicrobium]|jgi:uncharacterized membrane protein|uniref:DUF2244 domain-containing protein n=1 Tax=Hyphomicrobium TaxID=81 RepID=UPI000375BD86|nr:MULTISPECIES: DUF2244 domain-containing protein [Hyphomicrobium]WBT38364.1 DUF2244 domain-containing protein [Hyphomicrobium sp. DMF-1]HML43021.1 DUF2244 domain-containing protein [Hyphomicrobium zavarzinii]
MNDSVPATSDASLFRAILHPHRSLGPKGFLILMIGIGAVSFVTGLVFLLLGAWPVMGFFGLDVLLVYIAFKLNYRAARAYELVELTPHALKLTQISASGKSKSFEFNPYWVRVLFTERPDGGNNLKLVSHGRELEFGRLLNDDERRDFAEALRSALDAARVGTPV